MGVARTQRVADLFDWNAPIRHRLRIARLTHTDCAGAAVRIAKTVEQILVPVGLVASAVAMQLREQRGIAFGNFVSLAHVALETLRIERHPRLICLIIYI